MTRPSTPSELLDMLTGARRVLGFEPAHPVFVTTDACDIIDAAAPSLGLDCRLSPEMAGPHEGAFYMLPRTLKRTESSASAIDAFALGITDRDELATTFFILPQTHANGEGPWLDLPGPAPTEITLVCCDVWPWGAQLGDLPPPLLDLGDEKDEYQRDLIHNRSIVAATLLLAAQPVTEMEPARVSRHARRRAERKMASVPSIRTLSVRGSTSTASTGSSSPHLTHRFVVRGHWRNQPFGPKQSLRRPTWIAPHIKGPEGTPLDTRSTVWRLGAQQDEQLAPRPDGLPT